MAGNQPSDGIVVDAPDLVRTQLARMSEQQLQRLLLWLDERGAAEGRSFAVHQDDPSDPATRELVELRLRKGDAPRRKQSSGCASAWACAVPGRQASRAARP